MNRKETVLLKREGRNKCLLSRQKGNSKSSNKISLIKIARVMWDLELKILNKFS
jgi:hypothetical protein